MNKREALVLTAYTGVSFLNNFSDLQEFAEEVLNRPIWTHNLGDPKIVNDLKEAVKDEFMHIVKNVED